MYPNIRLPIQSWTMTVSDSDCVLTLRSRLDPPWRIRVTNMHSSTSQLLTGPGETSNVTVDCWHWPSYRENSCVLLVGSLVGSRDPHAFNYKLPHHHFLPLNRIICVPGLHDHVTSCYPICRLGVGSWNIIMMPCCSRAPGRARSRDL